MSDHKQSEENHKKFGVQGVEEKEETSTHFKTNSQEQGTRQFGTQKRTNDQEGFTANVKNIFLLEDKRIWVSYYGLSLLYFLFSHNMNGYLKLLSLLLFPLVAAVFLDFGWRKVKNSGWLTDILFGADQWTQVYPSITAKLIYLAGRFVVTYLLWSFSWLLGILAFIYLYLQVKGVKQGGVK